MRLKRTLKKQIDGKVAPFRKKMPLKGLITIML
jgi:hypothetical protein